jgi:hypothetical protein
MNRSATATKSGACQVRLAIWRMGTKLPSANLANVAPVSATLTVAVMLSGSQGGAFTCASG